MTAESALAAAFRQVQAGNLSDDDRLALERLEHHDGAARAWAMIERKRLPAAKVVWLLHTILQLKARADRFTNADDAASVAGEHFATLADAASVLCQYVEWLPVPPATSDLDEPNRQLHQIKALLPWFERHLAASAEQATTILRQHLPASQKKNPPQTNFAIMLCNELNRNVGTPLYEFAALVAEALFMTNDALSIDAIRAAWNRDQSKRAAKPH
jgi:hypothetical protein